MSQKLNELVEMLLEVQHADCRRPEKTATALKECIDRNYVHVMFTATGTEVGVALDHQNCDFRNADFENAFGIIKLEGSLTLNYNRVKCLANIDLSTCEGTANLVPINQV